MGNMIGTISFDDVDHHRYHKIVGDMKRKYNLSEVADSDNLPYNSSDTTRRDYHSVEISGLWLWWKTSDSAKKYIESFLQETKKALHKDGATNITTNIEFLPI